VLSVTFKYQEYMENLAVQCPPLDYQPGEIQAYRFVFEASNKRASNNFLPALIIKPERQLNPDTPAIRCQGYALSLFDTQENAIGRYQQLTQKRKALRKILGTHLARGLISTSDGVASQPDDSGHFSLHEYTDTHLAEKFKIVSSL
jgi:hypothetical protein